MKHKEYILIGLLYLLSPFIGQLLVEKTYFIGTEFTATAYAICWLSVVISIHHFSKNVLSQHEKQIRNMSSKECFQFVDEAGKILLKVKKL